ncbi:MAG: hypothetical protein GXP53_05545 [Deltaproteobacteria bacterium]|nr:hypothetical protein [Deltaproteobacteria bacterium]
MPRAIFFFAAVLMATITSIPDGGTSYALDYRINGAFFDGIYSHARYWDPDTNGFDRNETYHVADLYTGITAPVSPRMNLYLAGDLVWYHSWRPDSEDDIKADLSNASLNLNDENIKINLGYQLFSFGKSLVFYDSAPGAHLSWNGPARFYADLSAARVMGRSSIASITLGARPGFLEDTAIFFIRMHDANDGFARMVDPGYLLLPLENTGNLYWYGMKWDIFVGDLFVSGIVMGQSGSLDLKYDTLSSTVQVEAFAGDLKCTYPVSDTVSTGVFLFCASGDSRPLSGKVRAFVSPRPYNNSSIIFFNGGLDAQDITDRFSFAGIRWPGVIAPGITYTWQPKTNLAAELSALVLYPEDAPAGRSWYGWETDLRMTWDINEKFSLFANMAMFRHGDMFETIDGTRPDPIYAGNTGINLFF